MMTRAKTLVATALTAAVIGCGSGASAPATVPSSTGTSTTTTNQMSGYVPYQPMTVDPAASAALTSASCSTTSSATTTTNTTTTTTAQPTSLTVDKASTGIFSVSMVDLPNPEVREIWVTVLSVSYHVAGQGWAVLSDFTVDGGTGKPVDLLQLQETAMALGFARLPAGTTITQIRLLIQPDISTGSGASDDKINKVVLWNAAHDGPGDSFPLKTPSGYESGVKIMGPWTIEGCKQTGVTIDFDGKKSIWYHPTGRETDPYGTEWILRPVIRVKGVITGPTECSGSGTTSGTSTVPPPPPPGTLIPILPPAPISPPPPVDGGTGGDVIVPPGSVTDGGTCSASTECVSGNCVEKKCVPISSGGTDSSGGTSSGGTSSGGSVPPGSIPNGSACTAGTECSSGTCTGGVCVAPSGSVADGGQCTLPSECTSGSCIGNVCAASGSSGGAGTVPPGSVAIGGYCSAPVECSSGSCVNSTCAAGGAGTTCTAPAECLSNSCHPDNTCGASGVNGKCNKDSDCTTGLCDANTASCVSPPATLKPVGSGCSQGTECMSNQCFVGDGAVWPTCQPGVQGSACDPTSGCSTGLFCDTTTCSVTGTGTCQPIPVPKMSL